MWRRWVGLVVGAMLGFAAGASGAARLAAWLSDGGAGDQVSVGFAGALVLGPIMALLGSVVGYRRGQAADFNRR